MKEVFNTYDYEPKMNSTTMRISVLEDRTKSLEKMLRLFEERINIKEEEKMNDIKTIESNNIIITKLNKKIKNLEKKLDEITIQKQKSEEENERTINSLNERIKNLEEIIKMNNKTEENNNINTDDINKKMNLTHEDENANLILNDFNELMEEKIYNASIDNENKINELLNLIHDLNKILEENENKINYLTDNFNKFQNDNINIIQMMSIHDEKINNIDFLYEEIHKLKNEIHNLASSFDDNNEEDKFTKQFLSSLRIK